MKARHSLRNFVALNSNCFKPACRCGGGGGGGVVEHFENDTASENSPRIKTPYPYLTNLVSNYLENNILSNTAKNNGIQSRMSLKYRIKIVHSFWATPYIENTNCNIPSLAFRTELNAYKIV